MQQRTRRRPWLIAATLLIGIVLMALPIQRAIALPGSITGKADIVITNKQEAYYEFATAQCEATIHLPDGSTVKATGYCISGPNYAVPVDGTYDYIGTLLPDGTYDIVINSNTGAGANAGQFAPGQHWGTQNMGGIKISYTPEVSVTFTKTSANASFTASNQEYSYAGAVYDIFEASSDTRVTTITTGADGTAACSLKPNTAYYAVETKAPAGFKPSTGRFEFRTGSKPMSLELTDEPGSVAITIEKKDSATGGAAQPGASLEGAEFRVSSLSTPGWQQTGATDERGRLTIDSIPLGRIAVVETKAPEGYRLDAVPREYHVHAGQLTDAGGFELTPKDDFHEHVIAFDIELVKYKNDEEGESGLQRPAEGVVFEIISNTTEKVVGTITTDKNGIASTEGLWFGEGQRVEGISGALPYDRAGYTVREDPSTTPEGYRPCPDWKISMDQVADGATLHYIVDNSLVSSRVQVVKVDAESGQVIPLAGFTFQLLDEEKKPITQEVWTPNHAELSEFTTDESGTVTFPEALRAGTYYIREVTSVAPYLLAGEDLEVTIGKAGDETPVTIVKFPNKQAHGAATLIKTCSQDGKPLAGAAYDVVALEDVVGPDGAIQALEGQVMAKIETGDGGKAQTGPLPLGTGSARYAFVETVPPAGHVLAAEPIEFTLSYKDSSTAVSRVTIDVSDEPTKVHVSKTILNTDKPLENVEFALWNTKDEVSLAPDEPGGLSVRIPGSTELLARHVVPYAIVDLDAPKGFQVELTAEGQEPIKLNEGANELEAGSYRVTAHELGATVGPENVSLDLERDTHYTLKITNGLLGPAIDATEDGTAHKPFAVPYNEPDDSCNAKDLAAGTYRLTLGGTPVGSVEIDNATTYAVVSDGRVKPMPILLKDGAEPQMAQTDEHGQLEFRHLGTGTYRVREASAPEGIVRSSHIHEFTVGKDGLVEQQAVHEIHVENDFTKVEISKRDITTEEEVAGAKLTLADINGNVVDSWVSTAAPHRIDRLAPGEYTLTEQMTPHTYDQAQSITFEVKETGEVQKVAMYDEPIFITGEVDKRQEIAKPTASGTEPNGDGLNRAQAQANEDGTYSYSLDFRNTSTTWVDEFTVQDDLVGVERGVVELVALTTPQAWQDYDGLMNVWYRTSNTAGDLLDETGANATLDDAHANPWLHDTSNVEKLGGDGRALGYRGWRLWRQNVPTTEANLLEVSELDLEKGELVTAIRLEYGRVEEGFTTREADWERDLLKDPHDDIDMATREHEGEVFSHDDEERPYAPALLHMRVNDSYTPKTDLENSARVDLFRNGGGEGLEAHADDFVTQRPKKASSPTPSTPLSKTGDTSRTGAILLLGTLCIAAGTIASAWKTRAARQ